MKIKIFFLLLVLVPLSLYAGNPNGEPPKSEKSADTLFFKCGEFGVDMAREVLILIPPEKLAFTDKDIKYFNMETAEIVFNNDSFVHDSLFILSSLYHRGGLYNIYINDKLLFENIPFVTPFESFAFNDLVLFCEFETLYLKDGYPGIWIGWDVPDELQKTRDENAQKRKPEWDIFIKYLTDAGKIMGQTAIKEPPATPELNAISIYPNPTMGKLRITNSKLRIKDIQIFNVTGNKIPLSVEKAGDEIDISHLPAGTYFVQVTTEKGIVTKKVVKL